MIPAGCFEMGSPVDEPFRGLNTEAQHQVTLTHPFLVAVNELTQGEWVDAGNPNLAGTTSNGTGGTDCVASDCPASTMSWLEAVNYLNQRSKAEGRQSCIVLDSCSGNVGKDFDCTGYHQATASYYDCDGYRLPTREEFEYALRAGTLTAFYSGPFDPSSASACVDVLHLDPTAWYCVNAGNRTHPVGQKTANPWGLHDMMGNVMEFNASNPFQFDPNAHDLTDPESVLSVAGQFGMENAPYFGWPDIMRSANNPLPAAALDAGAKLSRGQGVGFRVMRTVGADEASKW